MVLFFWEYWRFQPLKRTSQMVSKNIWFSNLEEFWCFPLQVSLICILQIEYNHDSHIPVCYGPSSTDVKAIQQGRSAFQIIYYQGFGPNFYGSCGIIEFFLEIEDKNKKFYLPCCAVTMNKKYRGFTKRSEIKYLQFLKVFFNK